MITPRGLTATAGAAAGACGDSTAAVGTAAADGLATGVSPTLNVWVAFCIAAGVKTLGTASDMTFEFTGGCVVVPTLMSEGDLRRDWRTGAGVAVGAELDLFEVVSSGVLVDVVALIPAPPLLTATPAGADVVFEPVDVEGATDVFDVAVDELVDPDDDELDGSAHAIPELLNRTAPTPSATARPPIRPTWASPRTRQLYRRQ